MSIRRNDPCYCGSGKKYKKCCINKQADIPETVLSELLKQQVPEPNLNLVPSIIWKGFRWRSIWNKMYHRPINETFHEFLINVLLWTLGKEWHEKEIYTEPTDRHIIMNWLFLYSDWQKTTQIPENQYGENLWGARPSGIVQALLSVAYDLFCLQTVNKLPGFLIKKIQNKQEFQGARYEIAVAAIMARSGFDITFLDDIKKSVKHCEFIAYHRKSGIEVGVEAKSRRRKGILHESGEFDINGEIRGDIWNLYNKARSQKPDGLPYLIFIDLNLPPTPQIPPEKKPWIKDIYNMLDKYGEGTPENPDLFNALISTNFSYYYGGNTGISPKGNYTVFISKYSKTPLLETYLLDDIIQSLNSYNKIPDKL
ncbi:MAG: SEC-C domain-containing protein [Desulfitobacteriaceae bacterium]